MNRSALTLLEVLLALALLTAATAAGASLMQTSRSAAGGSAQRFDAAGVLRRWQADTSARVAPDSQPLQPLQPWARTDPKGRTWSVVETPAPAPAPGTDTGPVRDDDEHLPTIDWVSIELYCAPSPGAGPELVLRALVPAHAEHDARGAP